MQSCLFVELSKILMNYSSLFSLVLCEASVLEHCNSLYYNDDIRIIFK